MWNFPVQPPQASTFAPEHDLIFSALTGLTLLFTLIVAAAVVFFAIRYRAGSKADRSRPVYEDLRLEITWSVIPLLLGLVMFYAGARLYVKMRTPPKDAEEIFVVGKQWMWHIQHRNGVRENNTLHVPIGRPVKLTMISQDVIHAFYVPAFRTQMYVVPGRYTQLWFTATKEGEYHLFCNLYCGTQHSEMGGTVIAMPPRQYADWLANGGNTVPPMSMEQAGAKLFTKLACNNCHGAGDTARAPSLVGLFGRKRTFSNGPAAIVDEAYLRESILRPWNRLTTGYGQTMPAYDGQVSEEEVLNLVAYLKALGTTAVLPPAPTATRPGDEESNGQLSVGALRANAPKATPTPTINTNNPAVGAIAAEGQTEGQNKQ